MPQPIYIINRMQVFAILEVVKEKHAKNALAYGLSTPREIRVLIESEFGDARTIRISKLTTLLADMRGGKMCKGADEGLEDIIKAINKHRSVEDAPTILDHGALFVFGDETIEVIPPIEAGKQAPFPRVGGKKHKEINHIE